MTEQTIYLDTQRAARLLGLSAKTLSRFRVSGGGPVFHKFGSLIRYGARTWRPGRIRAAAHPRPTTAPRFRDRAGEGAGDEHAPASGHSDASNLRGAAAACLAAAAVLAMPEIASASTDTTFDAPLDTVEDIVGGTGGQLAAALAVGAALVGSVLRFNAMQLMGAVGVGIAAGAGTGIVTGLVGTAII